jgi:hypothetical protein
MRKWLNDMSLIGHRLGASLAWCARRRAEREGGGSGAAGRAGRPSGELKRGLFVDVSRSVTFGRDGFCQCTCADQCPLGKGGMQDRCHKQDFHPFNLSARGRGRYG